MPAQTLANRVAILERKVDSLEGLPARVASLEVQISQFREEVRLEFSAVREEARLNSDSLAATLRGEMSLNTDSLAATLRAEIRAGDEETRREMHDLHQAVLTQMRVLHEDVISRIALLDEHMNGGKRPRAGRRTAKPPRSPKR